mmetsp:Transcript_5081/g.14611  ORF Transcript_5081/g.14611 Transcript_5081/m.14611 type:complete len:351 (-) Transcript_5081:405-1457(-)
MLDRGDCGQPIGVVRLESLAVAQLDQGVCGSNAAGHLVRLCCGSQGGCFVRDGHRQTDPVLVRERPDEPIKVVDQERNVHIVVEARLAEGPVVDGRRLAVRDGVADDPQYLCVRRLRVQPVQILQLIDRRLAGRRLPLGAEGTKGEVPSVLGRQNPRCLALLPHAQTNHRPARGSLFHDGKHPIAVGNVLSRRRKLDNVRPHRPDRFHQLSQVPVARRRRIVVRRHDDFRLVLRAPFDFRPDRRHEHRRNQKLHIDVRRTHLHGQFQGSQPRGVFPLILSAFPRRPIRHDARKLEPLDHLRQVPARLKVFQKIQPQLHHVRPRVLGFPRLLQHSFLCGRGQGRAEERGTL